MNSTNHIHPSRGDRVEELAELAGGLRLARVGLVVLLALLACPPLVTLVAVAVVSTLVVAALLALAAAAVAAVVVPALAVRRLLARLLAQRPAFSLQSRQRQEGTP